MPLEFFLLRELRSNGFFVAIENDITPPVIFFLGVRARRAHFLITALQNYDADFVESADENLKFQGKWPKKCGNGRMATAYPSFETSAFAFSERYHIMGCLLYTSPSPRDRTRSRMPSSA